MISDSKKFVFIHIPKTGGSTVTNSLAEYSNDKVILANKNNLQLKHKIHNYKHKTLDELIKINGKTYEDYFKFTIVRNPYDRIISYVYQFKGNIGVKNQKVIKHYCKYVPSMSYFIGDHNMDFILKTETLEEDFKILCNKLSVDNKLKSINFKKGYRNGFDMLNKENIKIINRRWSDDFTTFGYKIRTK